MITDLELLYIKNLHNGKDDTKTLASKIGINQSMLYDIEAGRRNLTKDIFNKITNYYNVTYDNRRSIYDEAYNLTLELFSYIITYEDDKLDDLYDRYKSQIESYHNTKAFILCDLIEAIRNKYDNDDIVEQQLLNCCDFLDVYDNNLIFIYCILWCFTKDVYKETKTLEKIVLDSYKRYSLVGVNEDIVAMLYYQIGRIH
ncbi:MAG: helix-turn-helix transcriptional regulator, partial [Erysipelotrichaceae bacterium]|nr:helix-turn-helix transcriptional regulator [Erysipelotrichaceae bacterium]